MIVPIQNIKGLVYNESIYLDNALKILKIDIISKLPDGRKSFLLEKQKEFDPLISLKRFVKITHPSIMFYVMTKK